VTGQTEGEFHEEQEVIAEDEDQGEGKKVVKPLVPLHISLNSCYHLKAILIGSGYIDVFLNLLGFILSSLSLVQKWPYVPF
jgi:hypothetical protein